LNRTGTPLLEIVTQPDMNSAAEVKALAVELQRMVRFLGVSEGDMQKGHMRFEPNINLVVTKDGTEYKTPIAEIKNLNSFRALERSIEYEAQRQLDAFLETGEVMSAGNKTTRGWVDDKEVTVLQREKEEAPDYRYFPEPDLVPVELTEQWLEEIKSKLCELPIGKQMRYVTEYKLSDYDAGVLTAERSTAEFYEAIVDAGGDPKEACKWVTQHGLRLANEKGCSVVQLGITPQRVAELVGMIVMGDISSTAVKPISETMVIEWDSTALQITEELNLFQKSDAGELEAMVDQVLAENPKAVEDVTGGGKKSKKARGFLLGQVMQKTKGQANPKVVSEILDRKLG
jgi:aspartyl-tRNA(Asn)/glutamyl-tRNA(Gln) amidotransferase subunit B